MIETIFIIGLASLGIGVFLFGLAEIIRGRQARKIQEIELRKYCFEQYPNPRETLFNRLLYAQWLYQYLSSGSIAYGELPWCPTINPETLDKQDTLTRPAPIFQKENED